MTCPSLSPIIWNCISYNDLTQTIGLDPNCFELANPAIDGVSFGGAPFNPSVTYANTAPSQGWISTGNCTMSTQSVGNDCHNIPIQIGVDTFDVLYSLFKEIGDFNLVVEAGQASCFSAPSIACNGCPPPNLFGCKTALNYQGEPCANFICCDGPLCRGCPQDSSCSRALNATGQSCAANGCCP